MNRRTIIKSIIGAVVAPEIPVPGIEEIRGLGYRIYPNIAVMNHLINTTPWPRYVISKTLINREWKVTHVENFPKVPTLSSALTT